MIPISNSYIQRFVISEPYSKTYTKGKFLNNMEYDVITDNGKIINYHPKKGTEREFRASIYSRTKIVIIIIGIKYILNKQI